MGIVVFVKFVFFVTGKNGDKTTSKMTKMSKDLGRAIFFPIDLPIVFYFRW